MTLTCKYCRQIKKYKEEIKGAYSSKEISIGYGEYCGLSFKVTRKDVLLRVEGEGWFEKRIKYCPFCGREL